MRLIKPDPTKPEPWRTRPHKQGVAEGYTCPSCGKTMKWRFTCHICIECGYIDWR